MTIKLNGSTAGSVALDAPASTTGNADINFKLPVADGSNGQVITTNGSGQLAFTTPNIVPPAFRANKASPYQAIANNSDVVITFETEDFDTNSFYDTSNSRFTPTIAGYYFVNANVGFSNSTGEYYFAIHLFKNGTRVSRGGNWNDGSNQNVNVRNSSIIAFNGSSDYVDVRCYQNSGGNITINNGDNGAQTFFEAFYIRGL